MTTLATHTPASPLASSPDRLPPPIPRLALTRTELAEALGLSVSKIDELTQHPEDPLPSIKFESRRIYPLEQVKAWLAARSA